MSITLGVGSRLPAHATSMGRVLLAALPDDELDVFLSTTKLERFTDNTITEPERLRQALAEVRKRGWALVDQELEIGLRSIAAPITGRAGKTIAALNISTAAPRVSLAELRNRFLPQLLETAELISTSLARQSLPIATWMSAE
jgi:IclR family pca regulon transcriptional regulator